MILLWVEFISRRWLRRSRDFRHTSPRSSSWRGLLFVNEYHDFLLYQAELRGSIHALWSNPSGISVLPLQAPSLTYAPAVILAIPSPSLASLRTFNGDPNNRNLLSYTMKQETINVTVKAMKKGRMRWCVFRISAPARSVREASGDGVQILRRFLIFGPSLFASFI